MDVNVDEFRRLAADLGRVPANAYREVEATTKRAAQNIKDEMVADATSSGRYKHFSRSITYDRAMSLGEIAYEVGPDKGRTQGALGNLLYFGTSKSGGVLDVEVGLRAEAPEFERRVSEIVDGLLDG